MFGDGKSGPLGVKQIAARLNGQGLRTRDSQPFRIQFIDKILRNTAYVGEHFFNRNDSRQQKRPHEEWVSFPVPRIVEDSLFYAAQEKLDRQHPLKTPPRIVRSEILLTSVAKCGACGAQLRLLTGKSGAYRYYRCSRKSDSGETACKGVSIPMGDLDEIVLGALEETVLEPKRLRKMTEALVSRASQRNEAFAARQMQLDGERRKAKAQVTNLYRLLGKGELTTDPTLTAHIRELQEKVETLNRQIAHLDRERSLPVARIGAEAVEGFGRAVSAALRSPDNRAFARAYVQALISDVTVSDREVRISGPKAALLHQTAMFTAKGELVPSFAQVWRTSKERLRTRYLRN